MRPGRLLRRSVKASARRLGRGGRSLAALIIAGLVCAAVPSARQDGRAPALSSPRCPALDAATFVDSVGVNTHLSWPGTPYSDLARVTEELNYLGIRNLRDDFRLNPLGYAAVDEMMARGFRFDLISGPDLQPFLSAVRRLRLAHPAGLLAIEGPNEVDGWAIEHDGRSGLPAAIRYQQDLFRASRADPALGGVPVYNLSVAAVGASRGLGDLSAFADRANVHIYYGAGQPAYGWSPGDRAHHWASWLDSGRLAARGRALVVTETGSSATPAWGGGVDEATQARQILNSLMDAGRTGVSGVYLYELVDGMNNGPQDEKSHYGLFRWDRSPRPAALAIHNLVRILRGDSRVPPKDRSGAVDYSIEGTPPWGGCLLFERPDGAKAIAVWAEPDIWDERSRTPIAPPDVPVTIRLSRASQMAVYDPLLSARPVRSAAAGTEITVHLTDRPVIVEIGAATR